ncbi:BrnT family toxin [Pleomorphomonas sp. PLEO]|uniref:BrnT family toxin n=1 Tax=Pleomorphomonas sp. PLEO TaxID=3239306 RepID=UPI00351F5B08
MSIEFDPTKRVTNLAKHHIDLTEAERVFEGDTLTIEDDRFNYGEQRFITIGRLDGRMVVMVWTPRGAARRIISLRKANDREQAAYSPRL